MAIAKSVKIREMLRLLRKAYGEVRPFKRTDPVDEIVRTILSQNTNDKNSLAAFAVLKKNFKSWDKVLDTSIPRIAALIKHAGLANIKARRIKDVLAQIKYRQGRISLDILDSLDVGPALEYLRSLKGIGPKTAACVLLFSFGKPVMPVDTHIYRVAGRLGLIGPKTTVEEAHSLLTGLVLRRGLLRKPCSGSSPDSVKAGLIYRGHLCIIEHGRRTCKAQNPRCGFCVLYNMCKFKDKRLYKGAIN